MTPGGTPSMTATSRGSAAARRPPLPAATTATAPTSTRSGAYDLPEGADEDRPERGRRRRRDREDRGERTGILRLRRDRGEDIWPDDGISDEDYWASVAADRPLDRPRCGRRPGPGGPPGGRRRAGPGQRAGEHQASEQRAGGPRDQRGGPGRLGPAPGLARPGPRPGTGPQATRPGAAGRTSGPNALRPGPDPAGRSSGPNALRPDTARRTSGPNAMRPGPDGIGRSSGPDPSRADSGPQGLRTADSPGPRPGAVGTRPGTGAARTVGVTASRPPAGGRDSSSGPNPGWTTGGQAGPGTGSGAFPPPPARPTFQPAAHPSATAPGGRSADRDEWGERTERIERVNASGYPDPRPASRGQAPATSPVQSGPYPRGRDDRGRAGDRGLGTFDRNGLDRNGLDRGPLDRAGASGRARHRRLRGQPRRPRGGRQGRQHPGWHRQPRRPRRRRRLERRRQLADAGPGRAAAPGPRRGCRRQHLVGPRARRRRRRPRRRRPADQHRLLALGADRHRRPLLPGRSAPLAGAGRADRPSRHLPPRAVRDGWVPVRQRLPDRVVPARGPAVRGVPPACG